MRWSVSISNTSSHRSAVISRRSQSAGQSTVGSHQSAVAVGRTVDGRQSSVGGRSRRQSRRQLAQAATSSWLPNPPQTSAERRTPSAGTRRPRPPGLAGEPTTILPCPPARSAPLPSPRTAPALAALATPTRRNSLPAPWTMGIGRDCGTGPRNLHRADRLLRSDRPAAGCSRRPAISITAASLRAPSSAGATASSASWERAGWGKCFAPTT